MGTKADPGKFDCHAKAADDEPLFTLRAKDPIAPWFVRMWRAVRAGNALDAMAYLVRALIVWRREVAIGRRTNLPYDSDKSQEAHKVSDEMESWFNGKFEQRYDRPEA